MKEKKTYARASMNFLLLGDRLAGKLAGWLASPLGECMTVSLLLLSRIDLLWSISRFSPIPDRIIPHFRLSKSALPRFWPAWNPSIGSEILKRSAGYTFELDSPCNTSPVIWQQEPTAVREVWANVWAYDISAANRISICHYILHCFLAASFFRLPRRKEKRKKNNQPIYHDLKRWSETELLELLSLYIFDCEVIKTVLKCLVLPSLW